MEMKCEYCGIVSDDVRELDGWLFCDPCAKKVIRMQVSFLLEESNSPDIEQRKKWKEILADDQ